MKKFLLSLTAVTGLATMGVGAGINISNTQAATRTAVKSYYFDRNTVNGAESHFTNYRYARIPSWSKQTGYQNQQVGGGWNYKRYMHTNFYKGGY